MYPSNVSPLELSALFIQRFHHKTHKLSSRSHYATLPLNSINPSHSLLFLFVYRREFFNLARKRDCHVRKDEATI